MIAAMEVERMVGSMPGSDYIYGQRGVLRVLGDKVQCHICGEYYRHVGVHAVQAHTMTAEQYRETFGLSKCHGLIGPDTRKLQAMNAMRSGHPGTAVLLSRGRPAAEAALRGAQSAKREEFKLKLSARQKGKAVTAEQRHRLSEYAKAHSPEISRRAKKQWDRLDKEQRRAAMAPALQKNHNALKVVCLRGHPLTGENVRLLAGGWRCCRACARLRSAAYRAARKQ